MRCNVLRAARPEVDRKRLEEIVRQTLQQLGHAPEPSVSAWLEGWLRDEQSVLSERRFDCLRTLIKQFCVCVGGYRPIRDIGMTDVARFRAALIKQSLSPGTINNHLRGLRSMFKVAYESGVIDRNPVALVRSVKNESNGSGSTFTPEQMSRLVAIAEGDWKGLILAGFYTGARLMDLAKLEWSNVSDGFIQFRQGKTGGSFQIPIHAELQAWLTTHSGVGFVFPNLSEKSQEALAIVGCTDEEIQRFTHCAL